MPRGTSLYDEMRLQRQLEPEAQDYIERVERAEGQATESDVRIAINDFVRGCKIDGTWNAIKSSCIMAGARTLTGALVPLVGTAPTNFNFVGGDYDRKTGLLGNGSTKYLNSNRPSNADPQNSKHLSVYVSTSPANSTNQYVIGGGSGLSFDDIGYLFIQGNTGITTYSRSVGGDRVANSTSITGLLGISRASSAQYSAIIEKISTPYSRASATPGSTPLTVFADNTGGNVSFYSNCRLAFYSMGEALDLALLDNRVSELMGRIKTAAA